MDSPDTFEFVFEILKDLNKSYFQNVMSTLGFAVLGIGWIITSDKSRSFLASSEHVRLAAMAVVAVIALIHTVISIGAFVAIADKFTALININEELAIYAEIYRVNGWHIAANLLMNLAVFGLLILLIYKTEQSNESSRPQQEET